MKYIIMCGGPHVIYSNNPRPLRVMFGETLVERTIRLLRKHGVQDIAISSNDERFEGLGVPVLHHTNCSGEEYHWLHCFYPTKYPVCYLMGDVFYSPAAIRTIVSKHTSDVEFFGSAPPYSGHYIKPHSEPFAFKVVDTERFWKCIREALDLESKHFFYRGAAISWELWQVLRGTPINEIIVNYNVINDFTVDVDNDEQAKALEREIRLICI